MKKTLGILDIVYLFISIIGLEIFFRYNLGFETLFGSYFLYSISISLFFTSIMFLFNRLGRTIYSVLILLLLGFLFAAQSLHYDYFQTVFSVTKISIIQEFFQVSNEATSKIDFRLFLYFIPAIVALLIGLIRPIHYKLSTNIKLITFSTILVISIFGILLIPNTYKENKVMSKNDKLLYETLYNNIKSIERFGFYSFTTRDLMLYFNGVDTDSKENDQLLIDMYMEDNAYKSQTNRYTGMFEGKNVILVLCESLSPVAISEELTPTLYKMQSEGINFTNHYAPVFQTATSDSEYISLTGMLPSILDGPISYDFADNSFPMALPWKFKELGYSANSFHSFKKSFYNREKLHYSYGFDYLYDWEDLNLYKKPEFVEAMNWIHDKYLMNEVVDITSELDKKPYFDFVISVSGHVPYIRGRYELEYDLWKTIEMFGEPGEKYSEETLCYLGAQRTLESGIDELINDLKYQGTLEDTVIILYGDHYPYGLSKDAMNELFGNNPGIDIYKTPFIIWTPGIESKEVTNITSTFDIYPTIANLFKLDIGGQMIVGRDALSNEEGIVIFQDYSWLIDEGYYDATKQIFDTSKLSEEELESINDNVFNLITVNQKAIRMNYFAKE